MSNNGYKITHSNYVLRKKHQSVSGGTVYERDFMTTTNLGQWDSGSIPYGENNFRFVYRPTTSIRKRQDKLAWEDPGNVWKADRVGEYKKTSEDEPRLKPNYSSLLDFAYYGSCTELVKSTITKILETFPPTLIVGDEFSAGNFGIGRIVSNPFDMDLTSDHLPNGGANPLKYMCEAYSAYTINGENIVSFSVTPKPCPKCNGTGKIVCPTCHGEGRTICRICNGTGVVPRKNYEGEIGEGPSGMTCPSCNGLGYVECTRCDDDGNATCTRCNGSGVNDCPHIGEIWNTIRFTTENGNTYAFYEVYFTESAKIFTKALNSGVTISPNKSLITEFFNELDDFSSLLLNRDTDPLYTARLDWPHETERGVETYKKTITWPSREDGSLIVDSFQYGEYVTELLDLAKFYDEYYTDNLWRMLAHDSVKNMDLTFTRPEKDEDTEDYNIGTGRMQGLLWAVGRQFDDIKREIENIKHATRVTYRGDNNLPDYYLFDTLGLSGWETYDVGEPLSGVTEKVFLGSGINSKDYDYTDASVEFLKNLKLNTGNIFAAKGTKYAIESLLGMFGMVSKDFARLKYKREHNGEEPDWMNKPDFCDTDIFDYEISEYVAVANGPNMNSMFTDSVRRWNQLRTNYPTSIEGTSINDFYGLPVAEVVLNEETSYIVPWFNKNEKYESGTYFQMKGGWYEETMKYLHVVDRYSDLQNVPDSKLYAHKTCYVVDSTDYDEIGNNHYFKKNGNEWVPTECPSYLESIAENFDGNNPHVGFGWYDDGQEYIDRLKSLFKYEKDNDSADNQMFRDEAYDCNSGELLVGNLGFNIGEREKDSQKVWYFHNGVRDENECLVTHGNNNVKCVNSCDEIYSAENDSTHTFEVNMTPYNFEGGNSFDEGAENSVINLKNLHIKFYSSCKEDFEKYFKKCILPYLAQLIPSTTIFSYNITDMGCINKCIDPSGQIRTTSLTVTEHHYVAGIMGEQEDENDDAVFNYNIRENIETNE